MFEAVDGLVEEHAELEHRLAERVTFFAEASYYDSHASGAFDATPISGPAWV